MTPEPTLPERDTGSPTPLLLCSFCGHRFRREDGHTTCGSCPLHRGCRLYRCPRCGVDTIPEPAWIGKVREWWRSRRHDPGT